MLVELCPLLSAVFSLEGIAEVVGSEGIVMLDGGADEPALLDWVRDGDVVPVTGGGVGVAIVVN